MFEKFLGNSPSPAAPDQTRKKAGRPRKPAHLKHPKSKDLDKCGPDGRLLPEFIKRKSVAGRRSTASKARTKRRLWKRRYQKEKLYQKAYRDSLRRKYCQNRSIAKRWARKNNIDPEQYYQLDYAEYLLIWETAPPVYVPDKGLVEAKSLINNPLKYKQDCTYLDRLDRKQPYRRDNVRVFYRGKPLGN